MIFTTASAAMASAAMWWTATAVATLLVAGAPGGSAGKGDVPGRAAAPPAAGCAGPAGPGARCWPVTGAGVRGRPTVLRAFDPPAAPWAAGHRGVDLRAGPSAAVRAAAPGVVAFTGAVAGVPVVVVALPGGLRTTYEPVRAVLSVGARVAAGRRIGTLGGTVAHCPGPCLHWGLLRGDVYLDPLSLLPPSLRRSGPSRLLPLSGALPDAPPGAASVIPAARERPPDG